MKKGIAMFLAAAMAAMCEQQAREIRRQDDDKEKMDGGSFDMLCGNGGWLCHDLVL